MKLKIAATLVSVFVISQIQAQSTQPTQAPLSYTVTDLGTLGGSTSTASTTGGQISFNQAGMLGVLSNLPPPTFRTRLPLYRWAYVRP